VEERPITRYCKAADGVTLACHVFGDGPLNILWPWADGSIDLLVEERRFRELAKRLGRFSRTAFCDARGTAPSGGDFLDRLRADVVAADLIAWLDVLGFDQAVLVGSQYNGPQVIRFTTNSD